MTSTDALSLGMHVMLGLSLGILLILAIRAGVMRLFGPQVTYALWLVLPAGMVASLLPAQSLVVAHPQLVANAHAQMNRFISTAATAHGLSWAAVATGLWLLGAVVILIVSLRGWATVRRVARRARPLAPFEGIAVSSSGHWRYGPAIAGIWRPVIVVPDDFERRYTANERALILAHEATHARRLDGLANGIATFVVALAWFNPLAWLALLRFRRDQELACDASVLSRYKQHRTYGEALLKTHYAQLGPLASCNWLGLSSLKERVMMIKQPHRSRARRAGGLLAVAVIAASGGYAAHALSADTPLPGSILVQVDSSRADGMQQSSLVCVAPDQPIEIPYDRARGDLGDLYFRVTHANGNEFAGTTAPGGPSLRWRVHDFTPSFRRVLADGMKGADGGMPDLYAPTGGDVSVFYGDPESLQVKIKVVRRC
jgi:beta-lactamase regulating signal transducer with metallopeptidase domain